MAQIKDTPVGKIFESAPGNESDPTIVLFALKSDAEKVRRLAEIEGLHVEDKLHQIITEWRAAHLPQKAEPKTAKELYAVWSKLFDEYAKMEPGEVDWSKACRAQKAAWDEFYAAEKAELREMINRGQGIHYRIDGQEVDQKTWLEYNNGGENVA